MEYYLTSKKYPNYEVSNFGNIRNKNTRTVRKQTDRKGYKKIRLNNDDVAVHRLVAETFYDCDGEGLQVNHIDGNKSNNFLGNLEWVTPSRNIKHAYDMGLKHHSGGTLPIRLLDETTGIEYASAIDCVRDIGGTRQGVLYAVKHSGKYRNHKITRIEGIV